MSAPVPPPDQPVRPPVCGGCGSADNEPHCKLPACPWSVCGCGLVTGFVLGKVNTMPAMHSGWHQR